MSWWFDVTQGCSTASTDVSIHHSSIDLLLLTVQPYNLSFIITSFLVAVNHIIPPLDLDEWASQVVWETNPQTRRSEVD